MDSTGARGRTCCPRVLTRLRTTMSSSSGAGCSANCSTVRSRSMSSEPPRYGDAGQFAGAAARGQVPSRPRHGQLPGDLPGTAQRLWVRNDRVRDDRRVRDRGQRPLLVGCRRAAASSPRRRYRTVSLFPARQHGPRSAGPRQVDQFRLSAGPRERDGAFGHRGEQGVERVFRCPVELLDVEEPAPHCLRAPSVPGLATNADTPARVDAHREQGRYVPVRPEFR